MQKIRWLALARYNYELCDNEPHGIHAKDSLYPELNSTVLRLLSTFFKTRVENNTNAAAFFALRAHLSALQVSCYLQGQCSVCSASPLTSDVRQRSSTRAASEGTSCTCQKSPDEVPGTNDLQKITPFKQERPNQIIGDCCTITL